ncbi:MAG: 2-oxoacid:acceptor oxidoreductase subunit alpha [Chloroflexota bacterium]
MSIRIGGDAGQGVESSGAGFSLALARAGWHVFSMQDYRSRVRGGHNFYQIRVSPRPVYSHSDPPQLLLALTKGTVEMDADLLSPGAGIIYDDDLGVDASDLVAKGLKAFHLPLAGIAERHGSRVLMNTAAVAAAAGIVELDLDTLEQVIAENFRPKGQRVVQNNLAVAREAHELARRQYAAAFDWKIKRRNGQRRMLLNGNHAIAMGALAAGCRFVSAYPMTPATTIFEFLASVADQFGVVTKQAEDEIAAVCMAIGANFVGARAMTATSGGGFSLMTEALGLAGMTEVPLVVVDAQRGGPSTGLPTRTEQADLLFAIHASQGEFPRFVLAPGTIQECFALTAKAFNLAEKYQTPVIILTDQFLAGSLQTLEYDALDFGSVTVDRGRLLTDRELAHLPNGYHRFELTPDGISPRALPGHPKAVHAVSSDEHDVDGNITEEIEIRHAMMQKRMVKERTGRREVEAPRLFGPARADLTLFCWGSSCGPVREAMDMLNSRGLKTNLIHITHMWPFPDSTVARRFQQARRTVVIEQNYTGQLSKLIRMTTGLAPNQKILKYDGRPFSPEEIVAVIEAYPDGPAEISLHTEEPAHRLEVGANV